MNRSENPFAAFLHKRSGGPTRRSPWDPPTFSSSGNQNNSSNNDSNNSCSSIGRSSGESDTAAAAAEVGNSGNTPSVLSDRLTSQWRQPQPYKRISMEDFDNNNDNDDDVEIVIAKDDDGDGHGNEEESNERDSTTHLDHNTNRSSNVSHTSDGAGRSSVTVISDGTASPTPSMSPQRQQQQHQEVEEEEHHHAQSTPYIRRLPLKQSSTLGGGDSNATRLAMDGRVGTVNANVYRHDDDEEDLQLLLGGSDVNNSVSHSTSHHPAQSATLQNHESIQLQQDVAARKAQLGSGPLMSPTVRSRQDRDGGYAFPETSSNATPNSAANLSEGEPPLRRRRLRLCARSQNDPKARNDDDDDAFDDLSLLLSKRDADEPRVTSTVKPDSSSGYAAWPWAKRRIGERTPTVAAMRSLPWGTSSNSTLKETIGNHFRDQLMYEMQTDDELFEAFSPFFKDRVLEKVLLARRHRARAALPLPPLLRAEDTGALPSCMLRSYQLEGVQHLVNQFHRGISCILSDDMGLGKTAQIASFLHVLKLSHNIDGPHLIVAPLATITGWTRELARWAPTLTAVKYYGKKESRALLRRDRAWRHAVFVTSPAVVNQDAGFFRQRTWVTVVVDEAHILKTHDTNITKTVRKIPACFRLAVTGTPVHNRAREVWSIMSFLYPSQCAGYVADDDVDEAMQCARLLKAVMLRRTKEGVDLGIPPRIDEPTMLLKPSAMQEQLLNLMTVNALESGAASELRMSLVYQRCVCNHPYTIRLLQSELLNSSDASLMDRLRVAKIPLTTDAIIQPSGKMRHLDVMLRRLKEGGHRVLIFSNFVCTLDLIEALCVLRGHSYDRLDGSSSRVERELSMLRFNAASSTCFAFLVTTTAGGVGITLTGADTVILFDAHFNPQIDRQAADRAHRIGQTRTVHVYRFCLRDTVEVHVRAVALRKASLGDFIVDGGSSTSGDNGADSVGLSAEEIREMMLEMKRKADGEAVDRTTTAGGGGDDTTAVTPPASQTSDSVVEDTSAVAHRLLQELLDGKQARNPADQRIARGGLLPNNTSECFVCGEIMRPMEPLLHCISCPKAYHSQCAARANHGTGGNVSRGAAKNRYVCARHHCGRCGKLQATEGAIFMCSTCPRAYCFDCLDVRYFELDPTGSDLMNISRQYNGMEEENVVPRRMTYYIQCLVCCGVQESDGENYSEDDDNDDEDGEEDDEEGDEEEEGEKPEGGDAKGETSSEDDDVDVDDSDFSD